MPLLLRYPRLFKPQVSSLAVDLTDLMPTLLEIVGQPVPSHAQGQSLVPYLTGKSSPAAAGTYCFCERVAVNAAHTRKLKPGSRGAFMVRGEGWKYCLFPDGDEYLYHLADDPGETRNLAGEAGYQSRKREMMDALRAWLRRTRWQGREP